MGTGLFIIDAIIIAIVILPFVLFINGSKKRERKLRKALQLEAMQNNCKLKKIEVHGNFALGLDAADEKLLFYKATEDLTYSKVINLNEMDSCKFIKETRRVKDKTRHYDVIDRVLLSFTHHNKKNVSELELYNNNEEMSLNGEIVVGQKWQDAINELLNEKAVIGQHQNRSHINVAMS